MMSLLAIVSQTPQVHLLFNFRDTLMKQCTGLLQPTPPLLLTLSQYIDSLIAQGRIKVTNGFLIEMMAPEISISLLQAQRNCVIK